MNEKEFCFWLHGFFELQEAAGQKLELTKEQVSLIKRHLDLVFNQVIKIKEESAGIQEFLEAKKLAESQPKQKDPHEWSKQIRQLQIQADTSTRLIC